MKIHHDLGDVFRIILCVYVTCASLSISDAACRVGPGHDCAVQCHCSTSTCDPVTAVCQSRSCSSVYPMTSVLKNTQFDWQPTNCIIGNVAYGKSAGQTGKWGSLVAARAVDGLLANKNGLQEDCSHPNLPDSSLLPGRWWVDLGRAHLVDSVTVFNTNNQAGSNRFVNMSISVTNTSGADGPGAGSAGGVTVECEMVGELGTYTGWLKGGNATSACPANTVGRYVLLKRTGGKDLGKFTVCEVVVMGHVYRDCSGCPGPCEPLLGCSCPPGNSYTDCPHTGNGTSTATAAGTSTTTKATTTTTPKTKTSTTTTKSTITTTTTKATTTTTIGKSTMTTPKTTPTSKPQPSPLPTPTSENSSSNATMGVEGTGVGYPSPRSTSTSYPSPGSSKEPAEFPTEANPALPWALFAVTAFIALLTTTALIIIVCRRKKGAKTQKQPPAHTPKSSKKKVAKHTNASFDNADEGERYATHVTSFPQQDAPSVSTAPSRGYHGNGAGGESEGSGSGVTSMRKPSYQAGLPATEGGDVMYEMVNEGLKRPNGGAGVPHMHKVKPHQPTLQRQASAENKGMGGYRGDQTLQPALEDPSGEHYGRFIRPMLPSDNRFHPHTNL